MAESKELVERSAIELRRLIGAREISPRELMAACIARCEAINPAVNALAATAFDAALREAATAEAAVMRGDLLPPLHGLPVGIKDLQETAGLLTTWGNVAFRDHVPAADDEMVRRLRLAGAIVAAKTNVPDMGAGANTRNLVWGATGNPFDPDLNAGGSSGGSAAALATDMLPLCTGTDMGGSLRIPAALCGVVGMRPSPGLVPDSARLLGWSPLQVAGPMARDVADTAFLLAATVGLHRRDPLSQRAGAAEFWPLPEVDLSRLRVAVTEDFGCCAVDAGIRRSFRHRVQALARRVAACEPVDFDLPEPHRTFDVLRAGSFLASFAEQAGRDPGSLGSNIIANLEIASTIRLAEYATAQRDQTRIAARFDEILSRYDLIVAPVVSLPPFPWTELHAGEVDGQPMRNYYEWLSLTYVVTLATNPALSLPVGRDETGMPFGLQLIGPGRGDAGLLGAARAIEQAFADDPSLCRPRPDLARLAAPSPALKSIVTHPPGEGSLGGRPEAPAERD